MAKKTKGEESYDLKATIIEEWERQQLPSASNQ
jgi:hypothetical protein